MARIFFVVNEHAGDGGSRRIFQRLRSLLNSDDEIATTRSAGDGQRLAAEAVGAGHRLVVAVGGDGTVNETVNGLAETGFQAVLGILPAGGANDLAYALGLPTDPEQALATLRRNNVRRIDVGLIKFQGARDQRYYVNMLGMGVSGEIAAITQGKKRFGGTFSYLALLLSKILSGHPMRFQLSVQGKTILERGLTVHLANGRREGRLFPIAPSARLDDGLLDLVTVEDVPILSRPLYIFQVLRGKLLEQRRVRHRRVEAATIHTIDPLPCHMDGEPFLLQPGQEARVEVLKGALQVVAPEPVSP